MNELDQILRRLDELKHTPGRDVEAVTVDRANLLEEGFRLLVEKFRELESDYYDDW